MSTQFHYTGEARWIHPPKDDSRVKAVMTDFVEMLKDNPRVWAVGATEEPDGINVWTYVDSRNESDLMPLFDAEWRLMKAHPRTAFGFNAFSVPVGGEEFAEDELDFLYRR